MRGTATVLIAIWLFLSPVAAQDFSEQPLEQDGLHGTLTLPEGTGPHPAILIIAGSGPVDRDGNFPGGRNDSLAQLAQALSDRGVASVRFDKRGVGQSAPAAAREDDLRFGTYVADAIGWARLMEGRPEISNVVLLGHSEGALVATLAARETGAAGLVLLAGAGLPAAQVIERQLAEAGLPQELQDASRAIAGELLEGRRVQDPPQALAALYRPSMQGYLMSWLPLDPAAEFARTTLPALILQGTTDLQTTPDDAGRLHDARPDAELVFIEGMNHVLKAAPPDRPGNLAAYDNPDLPLHPELVPAVADFVFGLAQ